MDSEAKLYQTFHSQWRALILNKLGVPVANSIVLSQEKGKHLSTFNVAFLPGIDLVYMIAAGEGRTWIYKFRGLAT